MAMIICPECGKTVSEAAEACPKCGLGDPGKATREAREAEAKRWASLTPEEKAAENRKKLTFWVVCVVLIALVAGFFGAFGGCSSGVYTGNFKKDITDNSDYIRFKNNMVDRGQCIASIDDEHLCGDPSEYYFVLTFDFRIRIPNEPPTSWTYGAKERFTACSQHKTTAREELNAMIKKSEDNPNVEMRNAAISIR